MTKKKASTEIKWDDKCQEAFDTLKKALTSYPVLRYPDFSRDFVLETDASRIGISAILMQDTPEGRVVIGYASRVVRDAEVNYNISELECLAVVWGVKHFRPYLFGRPFSVLTDHAALTWLMNFRDPTGRLARWALYLQQYNFSIGWRPGVKHVVADALSRLPVLTAISPAITHTPMDYDVEGYGSEFTDFCPFEQPAENLYSVEELIQEQGSDPKLRNWIEYMRNNQLTGDNKTDCETVTMCRYLGFEEGILYHFWRSISDKRRRVLRKQVVVPSSLKERIVTWAHCSWFGGHLGAMKTFETLRERFWWQKMHEEVAYYVLRCLTCQQLKNPSHLNQVVPPLMARPQPHRPWEIVAMDAMLVAGKDVMNFFILLFVTPKLALLRVVLTA